MGSAYHYWKEWAEYLETDDERVRCEVHRLRLRGDEDRAQRPSREAPSALRRARDPLRGVGPGGDPGAGSALRPPPRAAPGEGRRRFGEPSGGELEGAVFWPNGGYISDPQLSTHNLQRAGGGEGRGVRVPARGHEHPHRGGPFAGSPWTAGKRCESPVVVNVAGPHSAIVNAMAGALDDMTIETKPLRQEVVHLPAPPGFDPPAPSSSRTATSVATPAPRPAITSSSEARIRSATPASTWTPTDTSAISPSSRPPRPCAYGQRLPSLGIPSSVRGVTDLYDVTDDWIPIYDKSRVPGFYMAIGSSGNQFKNAPVPER